MIISPDFFYSKQRIVDNSCKNLKELEIQDDFLLVHFDVVLSSVCVSLLLNLFFLEGKSCSPTPKRNKGIGYAGSTADIRMLWPWSALVCLGLL